MYEFSKVEIEFIEKNLKDYYNSNKYEALLSVAYNVSKLDKEIDPLIKEAERRFTRTSNYKKNMEALKILLQNKSDKDTYDSLSSMSIDTSSSQNKYLIAINILFNKIIENLKDTNFNLETTSWIDQLGYKKEEIIDKDKKKKDATKTTN